MKTRPAEQWATGRGPSYGAVAGHSEHTSLGLRNEDSLLYMIRSSVARKYRASYTPLRQSSICRDTDESWQWRLRTRGGDPAGALPVQPPARCSGAPCLWAFHPDSWRPACPWRPRAGQPWSTRLPWAPGTGKITFFHFLQRKYSFFMQLNIYQPSLSAIPLRSTCSTGGLGVQGEGSGLSCSGRLAGGAQTPPDPHSRRRAVGEAQSQRTC